MVKKKRNSLAFWIKCVDALGVLILISPWLVSVYVASFSRIYENGEGLTSPSEYIKSLILAIGGLCCYTDSGSYYESVCYL